MNDEFLPLAVVAGVKELQLTARPLLGRALGDYCLRKWRVSAPLKAKLSFLPVSSLTEFP
jgi:hypothetical protein